MKRSLLLWRIMYKVYMSPLVPYRTRRVRCLLMQGEDIILVREPVGSKKLHMPGGNIKRSEHVIEAARRELSEELAIHARTIVEARKLGQVKEVQGLNHKTYELMFIDISQEAELKPNYEISEILHTKPENIDWSETDELVKEALARL